MAKDNTTHERTFTWETKRFLPFLPPKTHTLIISKQGIVFDSSVTPWDRFFGFHGSMMHYDNTIVLKLKDVDHTRKVVGMSQTLFIKIPESEDMDEIQAAIMDAWGWYGGERNLTGYRRMK